MVINGVITLPSTRTVNFSCFGVADAGLHVSDAVFVALNSGTIHVQ